MSRPTPLNPFDEDGGGYAFSNEEAGGRNTNPFDEEENEAVGIGGDPYETGHLRRDDLDDDEGEEEEKKFGIGEDGGDPFLRDDLPVEASWHFLGDIPYRRVALYPNVKWNLDASSPSDDAEDAWKHSLASFPASHLESRRKAGNSTSQLSDKELRRLLLTTTVTKVAGCPNGGPIALVTLPLLDASSLSRSGPHLGSAEIRIVTSSGRNISTIPFPPPDLPHRPAGRTYEASDLLEIGFTDRAVLLVVLRDSLVLSYDLRGKRLLPPFHALSTKSDGAGGGVVEVLDCHMYSGGLAVLSTTMQASLVEFLDEHDDPAYVDGSFMTARKVVPTPEVQGGGDEVFGGARAAPPPPHFAIVTQLPSSARASGKHYSYAAIAVLPRVHTASRHPEVFLSTSDNSVVIANTTTGEMLDVDCRNRVGSPITAMTFAPNGRFLACFTQNSVLTVISTTFETKVLDFDTSEGTSEPPSDMQWCGEDSVLLHWKNLGILMVGPYGDWLRFPFDNVESLHLLSEIDSCRVVTDTTVEILQRVPPATAALLRIGSIDPPALLLDASDSFESGSPSADEAARAITKTGMLKEAIEACVDAATREFDLLMQKRLLRAASYGMHFSYKDVTDRRVVMGGEDGDIDAIPDDIKPSPSAVRFVQGARKIRVLNALRNPAVGFALTSAQFDSVGPIGVVARLIAMDRPALATSICSYLGLDASVAAYARAARAAAFVGADPASSDAKTAEGAVRILKGHAPAVTGSDVSSSVPDGPNAKPLLHQGGYARVALAAHKAGRPGVANLLLMLETSVKDKVPALLSLGSFADAGAVATSARNANLIFQTLMEYEKACIASAGDVTKGQTKFATSVSQLTPESFNVLKAYYMSMRDPKRVVNLLLRSQKYIEAGSVMAQRASSLAQGGERMKYLQEASRVFGMGRETGFQKSCTDENIELLNDQERIRKVYGSVDVAPPGASVSATLLAIFSFGAVKGSDTYRLFAEGERLAKRYKVPEKRLWTLKVRAFSQSGQWADLRNLADSRAKPPIGFKPFALASIRGKRDIQEIRRYVDRVSLPEDRYDLYCEAKLWAEALGEAKLDPRRIMHVRSICNSPDIQKMCDDMIARVPNN